MKIILLVCDGCKRVYENDSDAYYCCRKGAREVVVDAAYAYPREEDDIENEKHEDQ